MSSSTDSSEYATDSDISDGKMAREVSHQASAMSTVPKTVEETD
jgi:hypothetical protein